MNTKKPSSLLDQEDAVGSYLADMLSMPDAGEPTAIGLIDAEPVDNLVLLRQALEELPRVDELEQSAVSPEPAADPLTTDQAQAVDRVEASAELIFPLQCLMFSVGGQQLSMPLIQMSGVVEVPETLSRLPGSANHALGVFQYRGSNVQVVDSAGLLGIKRNPEESVAKLIVLQGERWAVTVDALNSVITVNEDDVQWHKTGRCGMSLGTIRSSLAQLLSPQSIADSLDRGVL